MTTPVDIRQGVADILWADRKFRRGTTTGAGDASTIVDSALKTILALQVGLPGALCLMTSGDRAGQEALVTWHDHQNTGQLGLGGGLSGAPGTGKTYELFYDNITPAYILAVANEVMRETETPELWAPSLVNDHYFESTIIGNWPAVGTPSPRAWTTAAADLMFGVRSLSLGGNAVGEGAETLSGFGGYKGETLTVSALGKASSGSLDVQLKHAGGVLSPKGTFTQGGFTEVRFNVTLAEAYSSLLTQVLGAAASWTGTLAAPVIVQSDYRRTYDAPDWLLYEGQIESQLVWPEPDSISGGYEFVALSSEMRAKMGLSWIRSDRDTKRMRLVMANPTGEPLFIKARRPFTEMSADTDDRNIDKDFAIYETAARILQRRGRTDWKQWRRQADLRAGSRSYGGRILRGEERRVEV